MLHFARARLYWECNRHFTYEDEVHAPTDAVSVGSTRTRLAGVSSWHKLEHLKLGLASTLEYGRLHGPRGGDSDSDGLARVRETLYGQWLEIVHHYSACGLTVAADKLVALAGVAKRIQPILNDEYLAGVWRGNLVRELLWTMLDQVYRQCFGVRPPAYRAPSWSWASVDGRLWFRGGEQSSALWNATVEEVSVVHSPEGDAIMGPFTDGFIRIRGKAFDLLWHGRRTKREAFETTVSNPTASRSFFGDGEPSFDAFNRAFATLEFDPFDERGLSLFSPTPQVDVPDAQQQEGDHKPAEYLCLALHIPPKTFLPAGHEEEREIIGLFLRRVGRSGYRAHKVYRRAGLVSYMVRGETGLGVFHDLPDETVVIV